MALHDKDSIRDRIEDDIYGSSDIGVRLPKYKMPDEEHDPRMVYAQVHDELMLPRNHRPTGAATNRMQC